MLCGLPTAACAAAVGLNAYLAASSRALAGALAPASAVRVHVVLGNEACDADSCVSAIVLAHALSAEQPDDVVLPVLAVRRADLRLQLERVHLLRRAGLAGDGDGSEWSPTHLVCADEIDLPALHVAGRLELTLVDHNRPTGPIAPLERAVTRIVDHHQDEGACPWVRGAARRIEYGVGSCASLVAEEAPRCGRDAAEMRPPTP